MKHVNENGSLLIAVSLSTLFVSVVSYSTHAQAGEACTLQTPEAGYASRACASPFVCMNALNASESADPNLGLCLLPNDTTRNLESVSRWTNDAVPFSDCQESAEGFKVDEVDRGSIARTIGSCYSTSEQFCDEHCISLRTEYLSDFVQKRCERFYGKYYHDEKHRAGGANDFIPSRNLSIETRNADMIRASSVAAAFANMMGKVGCVFNAKHEFCMSHVEAFESASLQLLPNMSAVNITGLSLCNWLASAGCCAQPIARTAALIQDKMQSALQEAGNTENYKMMSTILPQSLDPNGNVVQALAPYCSKSYGITIYEIPCEGLDADEGNERATDQHQNVEPSQPSGPIGKELNISEYRHEQGTHVHEQGKKFSDPGIPQEKKSTGNDTPPAAQEQETNNTSGGSESPTESKSDEKGAASGFGAIEAAEDHRKVKQPQWVAAITTSAVFALASVGASFFIWTRCISPRLYNRRQLLR